MKEAIAWIVIGLIGLGILSTPFAAWPIYRVWQQEQSGRAQLAEAEWSKRIAVEEAKARLESEELNARAEVARARGVAEAMEIEAGNLTENYIRYLWVRNLERGEHQIIYIPTEGGIPILEAQRLGQ